MGRLSDILKRYDQNDINDITVSSEVNPHDQMTTQLTTKPPTLISAELGRYDDVSANDQTRQDESRSEGIQAELGRNVVNVVSPLPLKPTPALLEHPSVKATWAEPEKGKAPRPDSRIEPLPADLERLVRSAANNALPGGPVQLSSGLVLNLDSYVLRWACCYLIGDRPEASRRLIEVHKALHGVTL